jgi:putative (di)nucleoside polyphosphate hydrolase
LITRIAAGGWKWPQGRMGAGEDAAIALFRELHDEIGTAKVRILAEHLRWLFYDPPAELIGRSLGLRPSIFLQSE